MDKSLLLFVVDNGSLLKTSFTGVGSKYFLKKEVAHHCKLSNFYTFRDVGFICGISQ